MQTIGSSLSEVYHTKVTSSAKYHWTSSDRELCSTSCHHTSDAAGWQLERTWSKAWKMKKWVESSVCFFFIFSDHLGRTFIRVMSGRVLEQNRVNKANKMVRFKMYLWNSLYVWLSSLPANPQLSRNLIFFYGGMCDSSKILYRSTYCIYLSFPCHALWGTRDKRVYLTAWISNIKPLKCSFVPLGRKRTLGKAAGLQRFLWESIFNIPVVKCFQCVCPFRSAVPAESCH